MADRPIIFSAPMVRALLEGRKTQTRRVLKKPAAMNALTIFGPTFLTLPGNIDLVGYAPGDRLWVREAWTARMTHGWTIADARSGHYETELVYRADDVESIDGWWPSIHMPREFSRLTLTVTDVRGQRLQDIGEADAVAEGVDGKWSDASDSATYSTPTDVFRDLWNSLHGPDAWDANPWVVALTFTVERRNIDEGGK